jgi:hypothetical protein
MKMSGWCVLTNSLARPNPLVGLTAEEYEDFACALVSYVALSATVDQTTYFMNLVRAYTREIASKARRQLVPVLATGERPGARNIVIRGAKKSLSH